MTDDRLARHVMQVFDYGLDLKERLGRGAEMPVYAAEIAKLKQLLIGDGAVARNPSYAGEVSGPITHPREDNRYLGIRYALACWLDEIFIADSPWSQKWRESTMEVFLHEGTQQRAWRFWRQAELAETRPDNDSLEGYLWCVMLGFRGQPESTNPPDWVERVRKRILLAQPKDFPAPAEKEFPQYVPPLTGRTWFAWMMRIGWIVSAVVLVAVGYFILQG